LLELPYEIYLNRTLATAKVRLLVWAGINSSWGLRRSRHRQRINKAFKDSPSLKPHYDTIFVEAYEEARELAAAEMGMTIDDFPIDCAFSPEAILRSGDRPED
jgi:hypothetical protein